MTRINLLRPRLMSRELRQVRLHTGLALLLALLLALSLVTGAACRRAARSAGARLLAVEARLAEVTAEVERWQAVREETRRLQARLEALDAALPAEQQFAPVLEEISAAFAGDCTVQRMAVGAREGVSLEGRAGSYASAAVCVERLRAVPALSSVVLQSAQRSGAGDAVTFHVVGELWHGEGGGEP